MKPATLKQFKEFLANLPPEWDDKEIQYIDFSWAELAELHAVLNENNMIVVI